MTSAQPESGSRARSVALVAFGIIAVLGLLVRIPSIAEPLSVDQGLLASAAKCLSRGMLLYRDVFDQKPPGIYLTYLAGFTIFGWTPASVTWLDILASAATAWLLFAIVRRVGTVMTATLAVTLYSALSIPAWVNKWGGTGERSVTENFIVVWVALAAWCAIRLREDWSATLAIGLGFFVGIAVVYKPNAGLYLPALLLWLAYVPGQPIAWRSLLRVTLFSSAGAAVAPLLALLWIWRIGVWPDFWVAVVDFNRHYVSEGFALGGFLHEYRRQVGFRVKTDPLWLGGAIAAMVMAWDLVRTRRVAPVPALALAWGGAGALVIASNGVRFFPTYFIQSMAPLAILIAWLLTSAGRSTGRRVVVAATAAMMLWVMGQKNYPLKVYTWVAADVVQMLGQGSRAEYLDMFSGYANGKGWSARADEEVSAYVHERTEPNDLIYQFGINNSGVYFASDRLPASKFLRVNMFVPPSFPAADFTLASVVETLAAKRPVYLIFEHFQGSAAELVEAINQLPQEPEIAKLLSSYRLETQIEDFTLYRRID